MAIAAHPGDGLFTMGAAVAEQIHRGGRGIFLSLSLGERGSPSIPPERYGPMQRAATEKAARILGAETEFLPYPDAEVPLTDEASLRVCDVIRRYQPHVVITHWSGSWHKDHQNCHAVVIDAVFFAGLSALARPLAAHTVRRLYFAENWEDAANFQPDTYLDVGAVYEKWGQACSQFPMWRGENGFRYNDYYQSLAVMRGCLSNFRYAVALASAPEQREHRLQEL